MGNYPKKLSKAGGVNQEHKQGRKRSGQTRSCLITLTADVLSRATYR